MLVTTFAETEPKTETIEAETSITPKITSYLEEILTSKSFDTKESTVNSAEPLLTTTKMTMKLSEGSTSNIFTNTETIPSTLKNNAFCKS